MNIPAAPRNLREKSSPNNGIVVKLWFWCDVIFTIQQRAMSMSTKFWVAIKYHVYIYIYIYIYYIRYMFLNIILMYKYVSYNIYIYAPINIHTYNFSLCDPLGFSEGWAISNRRQWPRDVQWNPRWNPPWIEKDLQWEQGDGLIALG